MAKEQLLAETSHLHSFKSVDVQHNTIITVFPYLCVCVCVRQREKVRDTVCVCVREREREREREKVKEIPSLCVCACSLQCYDPPSVLNLS